MGAIEWSDMCIIRKGDKVKDEDGENSVLMERIQQIRNSKRRKYREEERHQEATRITYRADIFLFWSVQTVTLRAC